MTLMAQLKDFLRKIFKREQNLQLQLLTSYMNFYAMLV